MKKLALILILSVVSLSAYADNYGFLRDSPIRFFTEKDSQLFEAAKLNALNNYKDGTSLKWSNPETGAGGTITPSQTVKGKDSICRHLTSFITAKKRSSKATFKYCKVAGVWKIAS